MRKPILATTRSIVLFATTVLCAGCASAYRAPELTVASRYGAAVDTDAAQDTPIGTAASYPHPIRVVMRLPIRGGMASRTPRSTD